MKFFKNKAGFTLIELMVVLVIIMILGTVAFMTFDNARSKARDTKALNDANQLKTALGMYKIDSGRYPETITPGNELAYKGTVYLNKIPTSLIEAGFVYLPGEKNKSYSFQFNIENDRDNLNKGILEATPTGIYNCTNPKHTLAYTAGVNGFLTGQVSQIVDHGASGTAVTAVANPTFRFVNWSDNSTANPRTDTNVAANIAVTANFGVNVFNLNYAVGAGGGGTITGNTAQTDIPYDGNGTAVEAVPSLGYYFSKWSDNVATTTRQEIGVRRDYNVTAEFLTNYDPETLTYIARVVGDGGTITDLDGVDFMFKKLKENNLLSYCKLLAFADGGIKKSSDRVDKIYNLIGSDDGVQTTTTPSDLRPKLVDYDNGRKALSNNMGVVGTGLFFNGVSKEIMKNKGKGAIMSIMKPTSGSMVTTTFSGFSTNNVTIASRLAHRYNVGNGTVIRRLDGESGKIIDKVSHLNYSKSYLTIANWTANNYKYYVNNSLVPVVAPATDIISTAGNTENADSYYVFMAYSNVTSTSLQQPFFAAFTDGFADSDLINFSKAVEKYYAGYNNLDTLEYKNLVAADSGVINDYNAIDLMYDQSKLIGVNSNLRLLVGANLGYKKDGSNLLGTLYDAKPLAGFSKANLTQTFASTKPLYIASGHKGEATMSFDGSNDCMANTSFSLGADPIFTITGWFKRTANLARGNGSWGLGGGGTVLQAISGYTVPAHAQKIGMDIWGTTSYHVDYEYPLNDWVHVAWVKTGTGVFSSSILKIYVNGVEKTLIKDRPAGSPTGTTNITSGLTIGGIASSTCASGATTHDIYKSPMTISDFAVYDRALSGTEILNLYNLKQ